MDNSENILSYYFLPLFEEFGYIYHTIACLYWIDWIYDATKFVTQSQICPEAVAQRCSVQKGVLKNFTKTTGKHLCQSLFLNKVAALRPATLLKLRLWHKYFPVSFAKFLRTPFLKEHLQRLLLYAIKLMLTPFSLFALFWFAKRNNYRRCSLRKGVLRNFAKFTGTHLRQSLSLIELQAWKPESLLKRDFNTSIFLRILRNF